MFPFQEAIIWAILPNWGPPIFIFSQWTAVQNLKGNSPCGIIFSHAVAPWTLEPFRSFNQKIRLRIFDHRFYAAKTKKYRGISPVFFPLCPQLWNFSESHVVRTVAAYKKLESLCSLYANYLSFFGILVIFFAVYSFLLLWVPKEVLGIFYNRL